MGILNISEDVTEREVKTIIGKYDEYTIQIMIAQLQPACHQTKMRNILNWLTMRMIFTLKCVPVKTQSAIKRENTGPIVLIIEMKITIIIIIIIIIINSQVTD